MATHCRRPRPSPPRRARSPPPKACRWTRRNSLTSTADSRSPTATASSTDRGGRSPSIAMPFTMRSNSSITSCSWASTAPCSAAGSSSRQASSWRSRRSVRLLSMPLRSPRLGVPHGVQQQVRHLAHRRYDNRHRALLLFRGGQPRRHTHAGGAAHARAAELHHQQILQRYSFPFVRRERTILRIDSITSSMPSAVESR